MLDLNDHIPLDFHGSSRVWIYQCSRIFFMSEALDIEPMLGAFVQNWKTHGTPVKGYANLFFGQFIVIMADETAAGVSGCSTDSSVHLIKAIEQKFKVNLFDRQNLAFLIKDKVQLLPMSQLFYAVENNFINRHTIYFDNTVASKDDLLQKWMVPVGESWLSKRIKFSENAGQ